MNAFKKNPPCVDAQTNINLVTNDVCFYSLCDRRRHWEILLGSSGSESNDSNIDSYQFKDLTASSSLAEPLVCQKCKLHFYGRSKVSNLNKHVGATHLKKRPHVCAECGKAFQYAYKLGRHQDSVHKGLKPFKCPECSKLFSDRSNMTKHIRNRSCRRGSTYQ